jgi:hypothetical protein
MSRDYKITQGKLTFMELKEYLNDGKLLRDETPADELFKVPAICVRVARSWTERKDYVWCFDMGETVDFTAYGGNNELLIITILQGAFHIKLTDEIYL